MRRDPRHPVVPLAAALLAGLAALPAAAAPAEMAVDVAVEHTASSLPRRHEAELSAFTLGLDLQAGKRTAFRLEVPGVRARATETLLTRLGPTPRVMRALAEGGAAVERLLAPVPGEWETGLGDVRLAVERELAGGGARLHRFAARAEVKAPTADAERRLGTGEWDARLGLLGELRTWSATYFWGAGWNLLGDPDAFALPDVPDGYLGVESEPWRGRVRGAVWLEGHGEVVPGAGARVALGAGLRGAGRRAWRLAGSVGLTDGAEDFRLLLGAGVGTVGDGRPAGSRRPLGAEGR
jgi:hypothetical protein